VEKQNFHIHYENLLMEFMSFLIRIEVCFSFAVLPCLVYHLRLWVAVDLQNRD